MINAIVKIGCERSSAGMINDVTFGGVIYWRSENGSVERREIHGLKELCGVRPIFGDSEIDEIESRFMKMHAEFKRAEND